MSATYIAHEDAAQLKALLTLAADGLAAEVLEGTEQERSAVTLGRLLGRDRARLVLTCRGHERGYDWPAEWEQAVTDHARATSAGATVEARGEGLGSSSPPMHERRPGRGGALRAVVTRPASEGDACKHAPESHKIAAGTSAAFIADVVEGLTAATTGGVR